MLLPQTHAGLAEYPDARLSERQVTVTDRAWCLSNVLSSRWLTDQLASLPGYDPSRAAITAPLHDHGS